MNEGKQKMLEEIYQTMVEKPVEKGQVVTIDKNQVFKDDNPEFPYVVEKYEYTTGDGRDYFSVFDAYKNLEDAVKIALSL